MRAEVRLRVPNMKNRVKNAEGYPIDHSEMRFRKVVEIPTFPRVGEMLSLETRSGRILQASIGRVDLDEARQLFVLSCQYAARIITPEDYGALADDPGAASEAIPVGAESDGIPPGYPAPGYAPLWARAVPSLLQPQSRTPFATRWRHSRSSSMRHR